MNEIFGEVISSYSRTNALEDGVLHDVTKMAKEAGIKFPVAITDRLAELVTPSPAEVKAGQSWDGRLWDVLFMFSMAAKKAEGNLLLYEVLFYNEHGKNFKHERETIKAVVGPGDEFEPVITLMVEYED